jgi:hypothetical protein
MRSRARSRILAGAAGVLLVAGAAQASSVTEQLSVSGSQAVQGSPRPPPSVTDTLMLTLDLAERWTGTLGTALTLAHDTSPLRGGTDLVGFVTAGVEHELGDHFTFGLQLEITPSSTQQSGATVPFIEPGTTRAAQTEGLLRTTSSELAGGFDAGWDSAGDSDLEWSVSAGFTFSQLDSLQKITEVQTSRGLEDDTQIRVYCRTHACPKTLLAALRQTQATLDSEQFSLAVTATLQQDTDLTVAADVWHYDQDPAQLGYLALASGTSTVGNGLAIAPLRWRVRPEVEHRFGDVSLRFWVQHGEYVAGMGRDTNAAGLRAQWRLTREWRVWATASAELDTDVTGTTSTAGTGAVGVGYRF